jgi:hypothetical protein
MGEGGGAVEAKPVNVIRVAREPRYLRIGSHLRHFPVGNASVLCSDPIQNVIQAVSTFPHFHKDHVVRGDPTIGRRESLGIAVQQY